MSTTAPLAALLIFVGTYTPKDGASRGIYAVRLDQATGALSSPELAAETPNPTFLAWHPSHRALYALGVGPDATGQTTGGAAAFTYDAATQKLAPLNARGAGSSLMAHVAVDATGRLLVTASYHGGFLATFPIGDDLKLADRTSLLPATGTLGPNRARQDKPHPHSVTFSPDNRFAYVCDLGLDRIFAYAVDPARATLTPAGEFATASGAGPRHSKISSDGRFLYAINELGSSVSVFARDLANGALRPVQSLSTLPAGWSGESICAEIRLHPNGRFVYGSNRGHDSLAVFARDPEHGTLTLLQILPCGGKHPRNFNLSPDGRWLVCANRDSDNLVSFAVDADTGRLTPTGHTATVPQAVCVLFAP
ncbi:MAG: lactonase family protein [Opitutae bacterium]|nr:lactonase family protein [Opitutae bacterium]